MSVQQESSTAPEESLIARLAALAALQPIEDDDAPGLPDAARTVSTFERLQGLSALVTAPINKVGSSRSDAKAPSRFSAPGLSADRDDDVDSWCSELAVTAARETCRILTPPSGCRHLQPRRLGHLFRLRRRTILHPVLEGGPSR
jgi:hypothetical protein